MKKMMRYSVDFLLGELNLPLLSYMSLKFDYFGCAGIFRSGCQPKVPVLATKASLNPRPRDQVSPYLSRIACQCIRPYADFSVMWPRLFIILQKTDFSRMNLV
jgi:hypothetical protein